MSEPGPMRCTSSRAWLRYFGLVDFVSRSVSAEIEAFLAWGEAPVTNRLA